MFRKMAIALVAASVFTAPVLAQNPPLSGGTTSTPSTDTMEKAKPEKTEKSAESAEKTVTKHRRAARHHRHPSKAAKLAKGGSAAAMAGKQPTGKTMRLTKTEMRRTGHGRKLPPAFGRAKQKHMPTGTSAH